jgi:hypothetical protein
MKIPKELLEVARMLGETPRRIVFVGGMVRGLLVTDPGSSSARPTKDVDLVVEVHTRVEYYSFCEALRARGFLESSDPEAPICRWVVSGVPVDVMPTEPGVLGFSNVWYADAVATAQRVSADGLELPSVDAPHFMATKLEAWLKRGEGDPFHHDLEDVLAVVDGRSSLSSELASSSAELQRFVGTQLHALLARSDCDEVLSGNLEGDEASQARLPLLRGRLEELARFAAVPDVPARAELEEQFATTTAPVISPSAAPWVAVRSSSLRAVRYDEAQRSLFVEFVSGQICGYLDVPLTVYQALLRAGSKGSYLARWIKPRFRYWRIRA